MAQQEYVLNGPKTFSFPFSITQASQVALLVQPDGTTVPVADYTVDGAAPGSIAVNVTWPDAPVDGTQTLVISRVLEVERQTDFTDDAAVPARSLNIEYDHIYQLLGDFESVLFSAFRAAPGDPVLNATNTIIAPVATRAGRFVGFDSAGLFTYSSPAISSDPSQIYSDVLTMQNDPDLTVGQFVRFVGYTTPGDGGANDGEIVAAGTGTADGGSFIDLPGSGLQFRGLFPGGKVNVSQFGAVGSGDESSSFSAGHQYAKSINTALIVGPGEYSATFSMSGYAVLVGEGRPVISGNVTYSDQTFPVSANTTTPLDPDTVFFRCEGIDFSATGSGFGLTIIGQPTTGFITTHTLKDLRFYGQNGILLRHCFNFTHEAVHFYTSAIGCRSEGCTNGYWTGCSWQNQAAYGVILTNATDNEDRNGGENQSFVNCEWAVCTTGIYCDRHRWLMLTNCLLDFCGLPLYLLGGKDVFIQSSYFGASLQSVNNLSGVTGFVSPVTTLQAVYGEAVINNGEFVVSGAFSNNVFVNYINNSTVPIVELVGTATTGRGVVDCRFSGNKYIDTNATPQQSALLRIEDSQSISITNEIFSAPNNVTATTPYLLVGTVSSFASGNITRDLGDLVGSNEQPDFISGVVNNKELRFEDSGGNGVPIFGVNAANVTVIRTGSDASVVRVVNQSGSILAEITQTQAKILISGVLKTLEEGAVDSGGVGFRQVIVSN